MKQTNYLSLIHLAPSSWKQSVTHEKYSWAACHEDVWGSGGIAPSILNLRNRGLSSRLQSQYRSAAKKKNSCPWHTVNLGHPAAYTLHCLSSPGSGIASIPVIFWMCLSVYTNHKNCSFSLLYRNSTMCQIHGKMYLIWKHGTTT